MKPNKSSLLFIYDTTGFLLICYPHYSNVDKKPFIKIFEVSLELVEKLTFPQFIFFKPSLVLDPLLQISEDIIIKSRH